MMSRKESSAWAKSRILLAAPIIVLLLLCFGCQVNSQEPDKSVESVTSNSDDAILEDTALSEETTLSMQDVNNPYDDEIMDTFAVEVQPDFPGGTEALYSFLAENIHYPKEAKEKGIQGKVFVQFVVGKDGSINNVKIARGVDKLIDDEAVRAVKSMPKWTPGKQNGKDVGVTYVLPISFVISPDDKK